MTAGFGAKISVRPEEGLILRKFVDLNLASCRINQLLDASVSLSKRGPTVSGLPSVLKRTDCECRSCGSASSKRTIYSFGNSPIGWHVDAAVLGGGNGALKFYLS